MNILVVGKFYTEAFALHIAETLAAMGHQVRRFEPGIRSGRLRGVLGHRLDRVRGLLHNSTDGLPAIRSRRMRSLWAVAEEEPLDLTLVCHDFLWPREVEALKRQSGAPVALWFPDTMTTFGRAYFMTAPYDALFFKDPFIVHRLSSVVTGRVLYLPECFNPSRHRLPDAADEADPKYACDVTTAGNQHAYRVAVLHHLSEHHVRLWGSPAPLWLAPGPVQRMYQGRCVYNEEKAKAFRSAKIVLNNLLYGEVWGVNVRTFEAAGVGAFQLVDWRPGLGQLFVDGEELVTFRGMPDLKRKIEEWLPREDERRAIGRAAARRALAEHTYQLRLQLLLDTLADREQGFPLPDIAELRVANGEALRSPVDATAAAKP